MSTHRHFLAVLIAKVESDEYDGLAETQTTINLIQKDLEKAIENKHVRKIVFYSKDLEKQNAILKTQKELIRTIVNNARQMLQEGEFKETLK